METLLKSVCNKTGRLLAILIMLILGGTNSISATPLDWMFYFDDNSRHEEVSSENAPPALSCKTYVNVSLGIGGYAVITSITLVNGPTFPWLYDVDIMGPLDDTVFCEQLNQELMVVVTEIATGNSCMSTIFVEDKLRPVLTCTPDTLPCNVDIASIDFEDYLDVVTDNCDDDLTVWYSYVVQNLPCNPHHFTQQILVTWTATDDSGNSATCQDIIYLERPSINLIDFPADVTVSCLDPNIDPSVTGEPTYEGEPLGYACQYVIFHSDQVVPMCNGAQKILRLWTIMDWCNSAQRTDVQEILIIDDVPPVITCPLNVTIDANLPGCTAKYTFPTPVVTDQCAPSAMIDIDILVSGVPGIFSPGDMVNLELGTTVITVRATDPCQNTSQCHYTVTVRDNTPPIPICHSVTVGLGADGMGFLFANILDFNVVENCGILNKQIWRMSTNCGEPGDLVPGPDVKFCCEDIGQTILVVFKVTDLSGNMNTCMFQVTVIDELPPVTDCEDITISITNQGTIVVDPELIIGNTSDNCFIVDTTLLPGTFDCDDIGENQVILTVTDQSGNTATCSATVTIVDEVPPVALCRNITVTVDSNGDAVIVTSQINNGSTDNCAIDTMFLDQYEFDCDDAPSEIVVLTVVDESGNSSTCSATVTILTSPPTALCQNITVSLNDLGTVTINAGQIDNGSFDDCGIDTITVTPTTFTCADTGVNVVVLTVTDISGNVSTCTATVTVEDNTPPVANCQDISIMLDDNGMAVITPEQINDGSTDNCDSITFSLDITMFDCEDAGPNIVTLTVTDAAGNTSTCTANVMVMMPEPPTALCQDITVTLGPNGIVTIDANDIDNGSTAQCGDLTLEIDIDSFDCEDVGEVNIVTLTVTDETGATASCTATVTVLENPPVANCENITVSLDANGNVVITAAQVEDGSTDDCGIDTISVTPFAFDCEDLGPNQVVVTVTDFSGLSSTCTAIVTVEDNLPPVAVCQNITVNLDANGNATITAAQINNNSTDNCDTITLAVTPNTFDCEDVGEVNIVTLTVTDGSGNTSTCTATVTVVALPPVADCQDITVSLGPDGTVVIDAIDVNGDSGSNCEGGLDFSVNEDTFDCTEQGDNIVILTVTDGAGNTSTCTATVTVVDDTDPICVADDLTVTLDATGNVSITASQIDGGSTDNCDTISLSVTPDDFTCEDVGENVVILTVTDNSGNSSTCTATVTVVDDIDPICSAQDITVSINGSGTVTITPEQVNNGSSDNCGPVTLDVDPDTFDCDDLGPNIVTLTVTDASGNTSTCTANVTVTESGSLEAICQNVTIVLDANGNASVDPEQINNGSGGGCEADSLTFDLSQTNFDCTDIGPNIVTLTVTDEEGNTATCTAIVTVEDNTPPVIVCPANVTLECDEVTDPENTGQFGSATATDNCGTPNISENATFNLSNCNVGTITRVFTATDGDGNTASCVQIVTISNSNPFTEEDITWPPSPVSVNICNSTAPGSIPNGTPTFDPASLNCANPVANFSDAVQMIVDNDPNTPCRIITRTWTVTDDCQPGVSFVFVQTINVVDMVGPVFTNIPNMTKNADANCQAFFTLIASATDCAGVTITNNSPYGATTGANASGNYPIGETVVIFTATDGCGNITTMDVVITVVDTDPAEFLCEKVIVILDPEDLEIEIPARTFVMVIAGGCTDEDDFLFSYSSTDPLDTIRTFDCNDVGVTTFHLWFWNEAGTFKVDSCTTADLDLRDPDDNCGDGLILEGNIHHEDGWAVEGAEVMVTNANMQPVVTNDNGNFTITGLEVGQGYNVAPFNDTLHKEGVSTLDLVLIQKHILGRAKLNTPYKLIAADANNSGHISAVDLLEIRKLILGVTTRFTHNTSWRFVDRSYTFPDPYNPFSTPFAESMWFDSIAATTGPADFIGVKIGDINASYFLTGLAGNHVEGRNDSRYILELSQENHGTAAGQHMSVKARQGAVSIDGMQFSLYVGSLSAQQLASIQSDVLDADQWYYNREEGLIHVSWITAEAQDLSGKEILSWTVENDLMASALHLATENSPEAYIYGDQGVEVRDISLMQAEEEVAPASEYHLYQNQPNPFDDGTVIGYRLAQDDDIRLVVFDLTGRLVYEHKATQKAGYHEVSIDGNLLKTAGIYYYTLYAGNTTLTRKMTYTN